MDISTLDYLTTGRLLDIDQTIFRARMDGIRAALYGSEGDRRRYTDLIEGVKAFQATYRRLSGSPCPKARSEGFRDELKDMNGVVQNRTSDRMKLGQIFSPIPALNKFNPWHKRDSNGLSQYDNDYNDICDRKAQKLSRQVFTATVQKAMAGGPNEGTPIIVRLSPVSGYGYGFGNRVRTVISRASEADIQKYGIEISLDKDWATWVARSIGPTFLGMPVYDGPSSSNDPSIGLLNVGKRWKSERDLTLIATFRHVVDIRPGASSRLYRLAEGLT